MILFFFGENSLRIREKKLALKKSFFEKNPGSAGFFEFDFSDGAEVSGLVSCLAQTGLFAAKKFVIAGNVFDAPIETRRALADFFEDRSEEISIDGNRVLLVFQEGVPKKNEKLWKSLAAKHIRSEELKIPFGKELSVWVDDRVARSGALSIDVPAKQLILNTCRRESKQSGNTSLIDLPLLDMEIAKLGAYRAGAVIREEDVRILSSSAVSEQSVFRALDLLASGEKKAAMILFSQVMREGDALGLLGLCAWQLRNIVRVAGARTDGAVRTAFDAARILKMQPFVAEKSFRIAVTRSLQFFYEQFVRLARLDREAKSGDRDPEEALTEFVMGA